MKNNNKIISTPWICPTCNKKVGPGVVVISNHWAECGGSSIYKLLKIITKIT